MGTAYIHSAVIQAKRGMLQAWSVALIICTFALTIQGRGFESTVSASQDERFLDSECVSCGACVQACPTSALT